MVRGDTSIYMSLFLYLCIQVIGDIVPCVNYQCGTYTASWTLKSLVCCSSASTLAEPLTDHSTVLLGWLLLSDELIC